MVGALVGLSVTAPADAWERGTVTTLAVNGTSGQPTSVEGRGAWWQYHVTSFGFNAVGEVSGNATLFVISPAGELVREVAIANSSSHMLGLRFSPVNGFLLALDFGAGQVLRVDPVSGTSSVFVPAIAGSGLNGLTFDKLGNAYITLVQRRHLEDRSQRCGSATLGSDDPLLSPGTGLTSPFGANGIEFNARSTRSSSGNGGAVHHRPTGGYRG